MIHFDGTIQYSSENFYNRLGHRYDIMTRDAQRWHSAKELYRQLFSQWDTAHDPKVILDAGCGSGGEALILAELGYNTIGIDTSSELIGIAQQKALTAKVNAKFFVDDLRTLSSVQDNTINTLLCRGNTLPHIKSLEDMKATLKSFRRVVKPEGLLILQWLNYVPILKTGKRLVGVSGDEDSTFIRFYDLESDERLIFNIIEIKTSSNMDTDWISTELHPWSADDIGMLLIQTGWTNLEIAGSLQRDDFDPDNSKDVVYFAVRGS